MSHEERLQRLRLTSLESGDHKTTRRSIPVIQVFKISKGFDNIKFKFLTVSDTGLEGHKLKCINHRFICIYENISFQ